MCVTQAVNIVKDKSTSGHTGVDRAGSQIQTTGFRAVKPACPVWIILEMCLHKDTHTTHKHTNTQTPHTHTHTHTHTTHPHTHTHTPHTPHTTHTHTGPQHLPR